MKLILTYAPFYIVLFLIFGIITGYYFEVNLIYLFFALILELLVLMALYLKLKQQNKYVLYFSFVTFLISFTLGISSISIKNQLNSKQHYSHFIDKNVSNNTVYEVKVVVEKVLKPMLNQQKYEVKVMSINQRKCHGKVLLNCLATNLKTTFKVDQPLLLYASFKLIEAPKNPYTFNYQQYLQKQQIHHQLFTYPNQIKVLPFQESSLKGFASRVRVKINQKLAPFSIPNNELAVVNALLLGQRQDISKELLESYINAGAIHILAVSGLHIGIILMILNFILQPIDRFKNGKYYKIVILVLLLWIYALIAGLSPSVVRAVTMFSVIAIGINLKKTYHILNILIISLLILLLINPFYLFDVGFQLSYAAVFSIVVFQPILNSFWKPTNRIISFYWNLFTVSISAQLGVLPISLYYFHQFPGLFFVSNLFIIPFLGIILMGGLLLFALALLNILPAFLVKMYTIMIFMMNVIVEWISAQESFLIREIPFNLWMLMTLFSIIFCVLIFLNSRTYQHFKIVLISIIGFQIILFLNKISSESNNEFLVFHKNKASLIAIKMGSELTIYSDSLTFKKEKFITAYKIEKKIDQTKSNKTQNIFYVKNQLILVVDQSSVYQIPQLKPDIVILQNSPKINLERFIAELKPKQIISDGSNTLFYEKLWEETCIKTKTPFHQTRQKGAFILTY